jgi:hypothetical protein
METILDKTDNHKPSTPSKSQITVQRLLFRRNGTTAQALEASSGTIPASQERRRVSPIADRQRLDDLLAPVHKHYPSDLWDESWSLYWMPMSFRQGPPDPRTVELLDLLIAAARRQEEQHEYTFLEQSAIHPHLIQSFILHAAQYLAIPMIGIRPEAGIARFPTAEVVSKLDPKAMSEIAQQKNVEARLQDFFPDAPVPAYWIRESHKEARKELFGQGGWSFILSNLVEDTFFESVREVLLKDVEDEGVKSFPFVAPLFSTQSFIRASRSNLEAWFDLFPLYLAENIDDKGLIIACKHSLDDVLVEGVKQCSLRRGKKGEKKWKEFASGW